jgi:hypothetical protein
MFLSNNDRPLQDAKPAAPTCAMTPMKFSIRNHLLVM